MRYLPVFYFLHFFAVFGTAFASYTRSLCSVARFSRSLDRDDRVGIYRALRPLPCHPELVAGKAPWLAVRYACRLARCACRSSSQKSRFAAIFGSPVFSAQSNGSLTLAPLSVISTEQREWRNLARLRIRKRTFFAVFGTALLSLQDPSTDARDDRDAFCFQRSFDAHFIGLPKIAGVSSPRFS